MIDDTTHEGPSAHFNTKPAQDLDASQPRWDVGLLNQLLQDLMAIRGDLRALESEFRAQLTQADGAYRQSARNLVHYLALRRHDIRQLQETLAALGLSSLGRNEAHALAGIEAVLKILHQLTGVDWQPAPTAPAMDFAEGKALLRQHTEALLGPRPAKRGVRIMVTMPSEAAHDYQLVRQLVADGMNCMRINCAHDDQAAWASMIANLQRARQELGRECRIEIDLAGPKLRTGPIDAETQVVKWSPQRDRYGRVTAPAHVWLTPAEDPEPPPVPADGCVHVPAAMLANSRDGDHVRLTDLRDKSRSLELAGALGRSRWAHATQTAYLRVGGGLQVTHVSPAARRTKVGATAWVAAPAPEKQLIILKPGDTLVLTGAGAPGRPATYDDRGQVLSPATISCTLPEVFADVRPKERIWFDDGKIGGVIESVEPGEVRVRITSAKPSGDSLRADKGINLPDSRLRLPALTEKDCADLDFVVAHADLIGLSFVKRAGDVRELQEQLARRNASHLGIILKIETRTGFEQLPHLLLVSMRGPQVGVMIARGDLAVECGWERLAEVQEEILWVCEAAHVPVIWATQVLEGLAKKGVPSRAEITDAAMSERAECVMLNKGPHLIDAVRVLDDILRRMEAHQHKKTARLRSLRLSTMPAAS